MAPNLSEDEIDDLLYLARTGENEELEGDLKTLAEREGVSVGEVLSAARDESKATCLHMASGNGHLGIHFLSFSHSPAPLLTRSSQDILTYLPCSPALRRLTRTL